MRATLTTAAIGLLALLPGGVLILLAIRWWLRHRETRRFEAQSWNDQIASLKDAASLRLPPVRPLKAEYARHRIVRFTERLRG